MSSANAALSLFQSIREGMQTGRIANIDTALTEVEAAIAELNSAPLLDGPTHFNDIVAKLLLETGTLHEKVATCESRLAEFQSRAEALKEETSQIMARTEACNLLVEQQREENLQALAASTEGANVSVSTAPPPCVVPATYPVLQPASPRMAVISFPGGPRTVTIHPPNSPSYQSVIRDEKGDVIITLKETKSLRREGAFRGPLEDIDWRGIHRVHGRGPELSHPRTVPPFPRWPDRSQPSSSLRPRGPDDIVARQHQLSTAMQTDAFGRLLVTDSVFKAKTPSLPAGMSSSGSSQDSHPLSSLKHDTFTTPVSAPPSSSAGRGKKRTRSGDEDEGVPPIEPQTLKTPTTPTPIKRGEAHPPQGPTKRKKPRTSASSSAGAAPCPQSALDVTRTTD